VINLAYSLEGGTIADPIGTDDAGHRAGHLAKRLALLVAGPAGTHSIYNSFFIDAHMNAGEYPLFEALYANGGRAIDVVLQITAVALVIVLIRRRHVEPLKISTRNLGIATLTFFVLCTAGLIALSVYNVLGTVSPLVLFEEYPRYYALSRDGGAWMFLAGYAIIYIILMDAYFNGVGRANALCLVVCIALNSINGGRGLLMLMALAFCVLWVLQRKNFTSMLIMAGVAAALMVPAFMVVTSLRGGGNEEADRLNFNSAFIIEDVLYASGHGWEPLASGADFYWLFMPRSISDDKPTSTAETRSVYPEAAENGGNITFPLKANLIFNLSPRAIYLEWLVVFACHALMLWGIAQRHAQPGFMAFLAFFWGCAFILISRGGVINSRILVQSTIIFAAYLGFLLIMRVSRGRS
jgi:hypothetical protein